MKINKTACKTCPFEGENPIDISSESKTAITQYIVEGQNHLCHQDDSNNTICRGGRNLFLKVAASAGIISEPTDRALAEAMQEMGFELDEHLEEYL